MYLIKRYNDLLIEIDLCNIRISDLRTQVENIDKLMINPPFEVKGMNYDGMPKGSPNHTSLDRYVELRNKLVSCLNFEYDLLENLKETEKVNRSKIFEAKDIKYKIHFYRDIKNMKFKEIATLLNKSEDSIKKTYSRNNT